MRTIHFVAGLPRSGSTLLCGLLAQNPRFQVTGTSGLIDLMLLVRNCWDRHDDFLAMPLADSQQTKFDVLKGILANFHGYDIKAPPIVFDKSTLWLAHLEMAEHLMGKRVKVLVPVRDVRDVLASVEVLWRMQAMTRQVPEEARNPGAFQTASGRCAFLMSQDGAVGISLSMLADARQRGLGGRLHLVPYERLTRYPQTALSEIYDFLGEPSFSHNLDQVLPAAPEDDRIHGWPGLHTIRPVVQSPDSRWQEILGAVAQQYAAANQLLGYPPDSI